MTEMSKEFELFSKAFWMHNVLVDIVCEMLQNVIIPQTKEQRSREAFERLLSDSKAVLKIGDAVRTADWSNVEQAVNAASVQLSHHEATGGHA
jgi:predicted solute-binding protein